MNFSSDNIDLDKLIFDNENPRFISDSNSQEQIYQYLIDFENIKDLASNIKKNGFQTLGERMICLKEKDNYIVLEGNRRLAACRFLNNNGEKITSLFCDIVSNRKDADYTIASKHISGIKKWPSITRKYFYAKKFMSGYSLDDIAQYSPEPKGAIKKQIIGYKFIDYFYTINKHKLPDSERHLEQIDTDILDSRIFLRLKEVLGFDIDEKTLNVVHKDENQKKYFDAILNKIGNAIWKKDSCNVDFNTRTINSKNDWEKVVQDDAIIPGLSTDINNYLGRLEQDKDTNQFESPSQDDLSNNDELPFVERTSISGEKFSSDNLGEINNNVMAPESYIPQIKLKRQIVRPKLLTQTQLNELQQLCSKNDKIQQVVFELNSLYLDRQPISISFLVRALCEYINQLYDDNKGTSYYNRQNLASGLITLVSALCSQKKIDNKVAINIRDILSKGNMIDILNGTIHHIDIQARISFLIESYDTIHPLITTVSNELCGISVKGGVV